MKKLIISVLFTAAAATGPVAAHDFTATYTSQGQCERAWAQMNKVDRDFLPSFRPDLFTTHGDVMRYLTKYVTCEYDPTEEVWYIADNRPR